MTLPSALIIEFLTFGCSRSSSHDQPLDALPLQAQVAAGRATAADDRQLAFLAVGARLGFGDVDERANHDVLAVVGRQPRRHRLEGAGEEQVQQHRLDEVVEVMAERDLGGAGLLRQPVQARRGEAARTSEHGVSSLSSLSSITAPMLVCSLWNSQPRSWQASATCLC